MTSFQQTIEKIPLTWFPFWLYLILFLFFLSPLLFYAQSLSIKKKNWTQIIIVEIAFAIAFNSTILFLPREMKIYASAKYVLITFFTNVVLFAHILYIFKRSKASLSQILEEPNFNSWIIAFSYHCLKPILFFLILIFFLLQFFPVPSIVIGYATAHNYHSQNLFLAFDGDSLNSGFSFFVIETNKLWTTLAKRNIFSQMRRYSDSLFFDKRYRNIGIFLFNKIHSQPSFANDIITQYPFEYLPDVYGSKLDKALFLSAPLEIWPNLIFAKARSLTNKDLRSFNDFLLENLTTSRKPLVNSFLLFFWGDDLQTYGFSEFIPWPKGNPLATPTIQAYSDLHEPQIASALNMAFLYYQNFQSDPPKSMDDFEAKEMYNEEIKKLQECLSFEKLNFLPLQKIEKYVNENIEAILE